MDESSRLDTQTLWTTIDIIDRERERKKKEGELPHTHTYLQINPFFFFCINKYDHNHQYCIYRTDKRQYI